LAPQIAGGIVLHMPMAVILEPLNSMLADPGTTAYTTAAAVAAQATSCRGAVEQLGLLNGLSPKVLREANAVFAAMPDEVDQGILAALRNGFGRQSSMKLYWQEDKTPGDPAVAHRVDDQDDWIHVYVIAHSGERFV
jgi:hypothetical protein